jgi:hypothetical protein
VLWQVEKMWHGSRIIRRGKPSDSQDIFNEFTISGHGYVVA